MSSYVYDTANAQEVAITVGGGLGESDIGGPVMNLVPKSGGNIFKGTGFFNGAGDWSRGNNLTTSSRAIGLTQTPGIIQSYDASGSYGGPIMKDRLWFYGSYRNLDTQTAMEGITANANAGDAVALGLGRLADQRAPGAGPPDDHRPPDGPGWARAASRSTPSTSIAAKARRSRSTRRAATTAATTGSASATTPRRSSRRKRRRPRRAATSTCRTTSIRWPGRCRSTQQAAPRGRLHAFRYNPLFGFPPPDGITNLIPVTEQSNAINPATGLRYAPQPTYTYRGVEQWGWAVGKTDGWQATASYVTGAHSMKVGYQGNRLDQLDQTLTESDAARLPLQPGRAERGDATGCPTSATARSRTCTACSSRTAGPAAA